MKKKYPLLLAAFVPAFAFSGNVISLSQVKDAINELKDLGVQISYKLNEAPAEAGAEELMQDKIAFADIAEPLSQTGQSSQPVRSTQSSQSVRSVESLRSLQFPPALEETPVSRSAADQRRLSVGLSTAHENLSNNSPAWKDTTLKLTYELAPRHNISASLTEAERFGQHDTQANIEYTFPVTKKLTVNMDANASPTHSVLAKNGVGGTIQYEFAPAWLLHTGGKSTSYNDVRVNQALFMVEHYFSAFSMSAAWRPSRAFGTTAHSGEVRASYYYGDRNSTTLLFAAGKEATNLGTSIVLANVQAVALLGRFGLNRHWSLNYAVDHTRQDNFYIRNGFNVGLEYAF